MSGSGDIDGEVSGEEAAWRDLVARFDSPPETDVAAAPWPARENLIDSDTAAAERPAPLGDSGERGSEAASAADSASPPDSASRSFTWSPDPARPASTAGPADRTRIVRPAGDPRSWTAEEEDDGPYVPDPLPPPAKMDSLTKGAWVALVCGPAYLLLGTLAGWSISGTEALAAIAAFIGGFVILVIKMGDRPPRDDNDDGAVL